MIILPAEQTLDWKRPPIATLAILLLNCVIYFGYQLGDDARFDTAYTYYVESGLVEREAPIYLDYIENNKQTLEIVETKRFAERHGNVGMVEVIFMSNDFSHYLRASVENGTLDPEYWDEKRKRFTELQHQVSYLAYGFVPAAFTLKGFFGSMFMHGSFDHLLGNMIVLFICGFALEVAFGRIWLLSLYLASGCLSTFFSFVMNFGSYIPEIGASGAISGLMGMYAGLYGMRQLRFFYWAFIFFGYFTAPALLIFPIWLGNEIYGAILADTNINYFAHLGGLLAGFGLVYFTKQRFLEVDVAYVENKESEDDQFERTAAEMWDLAAELKFDKAIALAEVLLKNRPGDQQVLRQLYNIRKANLESPEYHQTAKRIFSRAGTSADFEIFQMEVLADYLQAASVPVALTPELCIELIRPACIRGYSAEALKLAEQVMTLNTANDRTRSPDAGKAVFRVLMQQLKERRQGTAKQLTDFLTAIYPELEETGMAIESMERLSTA